MKLPVFSQPARKAIRIGSMCSLSYLAVYVAKNILSAASPQMIASGAFTTEDVGTLSSVYYICYAAGQLVNGHIGDRIRAKHMISCGLMLAGLTVILFSLFSSASYAVYLIYSVTGIALSMIYGPMTKVVAENTEQPYTTRCSLGYTFSSFFGSPLAGILAMLLLWQGVFITCGIMLIMMGFVCFVVFSRFERQGLIEYGKYKQQKEQGGSIRLLIRHRISKFTLISILTGVVRTTVVFWLPTYLSQYLGFAPERAAMLFSILTFFLSMTTFVAIFLYERLNRNMDLTILIVFCSAAACFLAVYLIRQPMFNILLLLLGIMSSNCAASMLWSRYCPSLRDTGMVSGATGFLDCVSYTAASIASTVFANAVSVIGWGNLILVWFGLMVCGILVALPYRRTQTV